MKNQVSGKTKRSGIHGIRKADIILTAVFLLIAALLGVFFVVHHETGNEVRILYDGIELKRITLPSALKDSESEKESQYFLITYSDDVVDVKNFVNIPEPKLDEGTSYNLISVADNMVIVEAADCKDQICVRHKPISSKGESIICLPHRLVVEIVGDDNSVDTYDGPLDGVVR